MNGKQRTGALLLVLAVGASTAYFRLRPGDSERQSTKQGQPAAAESASTSALTTTVSTEALAATTAQAPLQPPPYERPIRNAERAALIRETLISRKAQELGAADTAGGAMPAPDGTGNQVGKPLGNYVEHIMQEQFLPLATECYQNLLAFKPQSAGNVELAFSILGDPSVGGVVVDVNLGPSTTLTDAEFRTCMTESMFAVVFDAPPGDEGTVSVVQTFELAP